MKKINKGISGLLAGLLVFGGPITAFGAAGSEYITPPNDSLLVQYDFNETSGTIAHDSSGHGYDGVLSSGAAWTSQSKNYGAMSLDGTSNGYLTIPNGVMNGVHNVTVTADVYLRSGANGFITGLGSDTSKYVYLKTSSEGGLKTSKGDEHFSGSALPNNSWTHFAVVVDSDNHKEYLYVNGSLAISKSITGDPSEIYDASKALSGYIGKSFWSDPYVNGIVDNYRIYGSALNASQISALAVMTVDTSSVSSVDIGTTPGSAPVLPSFVKLANSDGTMQNIPVTWEAILPSKYEKPGSFDVIGHLNSVSPELTAIAHVAVMAKPVLSGSATSKTSVSLNWAAIDNATSYQIYRSSTSGSGYQQVYNGPATSYEDQGLNMATTYYYVMTGSIGLVQSVYSNELAVSTETEITAAPAGLAQNPYKFPYRTQFTWNPVPLADKYNIYRSESEEGTYTLIGNTANTTYEDLDVYQDSTYYYKVTSVNRAGESVKSASLKATTSKDTVPKTVLTSTGQTESTVSLNWQPMPDATSYTVYRSMTAGSGYSPVYTGMKTSYVDNNLITGSSYYYVVTYTSPLGTSVYSNEVKVTTASVSVSAPSALKVTASYINAVSLSWNKVIGATSFNVYRSNAADGEYIKIAGSADNMYKDSGLEPGTTYYYKLSSVNGGGESKLSIAIAATTSSADDLIYNNEAIKYDTDGNVLPSGGEGFLQVGDTYYMYSGVSTEGQSVNNLGVYSSKDLVHWKYENTVFSSETVDENGNHPPELTNGFKNERVKVVYDDKLDKYIMVFHYENAVDYSLGMITVSMSDSPTEPFTYIKTYHPDGMEARDGTLYKDVDGSVYYIVTANRAPDGANSKLTMFRFADDYRSAKQVYNIYGGPDFNGTYAGREAPAIVKRDGIYYLITSNAAGWFPSQAMYSTAEAATLADTTASSWKGDTPVNPWGGKDLGKGFLVGNSVAFSSQSTYLMPVTGTHGTSYILMSDRLKSPLEAGGTVWFPVQIDNGKLSFDYSPTIKINTTTGEVANVYEGSLISQGKPAQASNVKPSSDGVDYTANLANDGDYSTEWSANGSNYPAWWSVDLGQNYNINQVQLSWYLIGGSEGIYNYKIWVSDDGVNYTLALDHSSGNAYYGFNSDQLSDVTGRYVKVEILGCSVWWYEPQLYEVKIFGSAVEHSVSITTPDSKGSYVYQIPYSIYNFPATSDYTLNLGNVSIQMPISVLFEKQGTGTLTVSQDKTSPETATNITAAAASASQEVAGTFDLNMKNSVTGAVHDLGTAVQVTVHLTPEMLAKLEGKGTPGLYYYDAENNSLSKTDAAFNLNDNTATFTTTHLSTFVVTADISQTNQNNAETVIALINNLPADISLSDEAAVAGARAAYNALTDQQKSLVPADVQNKLAAAELTITRLKNREVSSITAESNILLVGRYAFDLSVKAAVSGYSLNNFINAAQTVYHADGVNHVYFKLAGKWYDIVNDPAMITPLDPSTINGDGLFDHMNMQ